MCDVYSLTSDLDPACCFGALVIYIHLIAEVTRTQWWMGHYCARTPKRHYGYANSPWISSLDKGVLSGWKKGDRKVKTAVSYTNKDGKKCYKGTPALRSTEYLAHIFDLIISYIIVYTKFIPVLYHIYKKQKRYGVKTTSSILVNSHSFFLRSSKLRRREAEIDCCWT